MKYSNISLGIWGIYWSLLHAISLSQNKTHESMLKLTKVLVKYFEISQ